MENKKIYRIILGIITFLLVGFYGLNYFIESEIKEQLNLTSENVKIKYEAIHVNSLSGNLSLVKPYVSIIEKTTNKLSAKIELDDISINSFSYWNYFINDKIQLDNILISQPKVTYYHFDKEKANSSNEFFKKINNIVEIKLIEIQNAHVEIYDASNNSLILKSEKLNFKVKEIKLNPLAKKQPITYTDFQVTSKAVFYSLNEYENLNVETLNVNPNFSVFKGLKLKTKYSKKALSKRIKVERDHYDLSIDSIQIKNQEFGYKQDSIFYFKSEQIDFYQPNFKIYRNKLIEDDMSFKPLYSKMLRDLKFSLNLNTILLNNASVTYIEKVKSGTNGGKLNFSRLNGEIKNLGNDFDQNTLTSININSVFMDNTLIDVQWNFNVKNPNDAFIFNAKVGRLNAKSMNQFMEPNANLRLKGEIDNTYFTINGNNHSSNIELKLKYEDFDVIILQENGKEKNKFLSSIVNIFVSKDSKDASQDFREGSKSNVERTKNKSVFNYLWINIKAGLLNAMTGNGKE